MGPRAENEYAVDPVGEATITPSAENVVTYAPSTSTASRTSRWRACFSTMISFSPCGWKSTPPTGSTVSARRSSIRADPASTARINRRRRAPPPSGSRAVRPSPPAPDSPHGSGVGGAQEGAVTADAHDEVEIFGRFGSRRRRRVAPCSNPPVRGRRAASPPRRAPSCGADARRCRPGSRTDLAALGDRRSTSMSTRAPPITAQTRNSTLPAGPVTGEAMTPRGTRSSARALDSVGQDPFPHAWVADDPPAPDVVGARLELGFHEQDGRRAGRQQVHEDRQHRGQRDEREVRHEQFRPRGQRLDAQIPHVRSFEHRDPRVVPQDPRELSVPHVDRYDVLRAALQQTIGEPRRRPGVEAVQPPRVDRRTAPAPPSFSPPRETNRRAALTRTTGASVATSVAAFDAGDPPTSTRPARTASWASVREVASPRRTSSASRRRRVTSVESTSRVGRRGSLGRRRLRGGRLLRRRGGGLGGRPLLRR